MGAKKGADKYSTQLLFSRLSFLAYKGIWIDVTIKSTGDFLMLALTTAPAILATKVGDDERFGSAL
jgi:ABC-type Mn2+/Zn2+ transport system permease subunit